MVRVYLYCITITETCLVRSYEIPDIFVLMDIYFVKLLWIKLIIHRSHIGYHLQGHKAGQD